MESDEIWRIFNNLATSEKLIIGKILELENTFSQCQSILDIKIDI
jgi:hypothetical protein